VEHQLQQALRTLRAIRQRYETGRDTGSGYLRFDSIHVALGYADMLWITAVIEALEKASSCELELKRTRLENTSPAREPAAADLATPPRRQHPLAREPGVTRLLP
jgi:hypothetical protein